MERRRFVSVAAAGVLAPLIAHSQQVQRIVRIGVLGEGAAPTGPPPGLEEAWRSHGWVYGQNLKIERRFALRQEQLPAMAAELAALKVDLVMAHGTAAARAIKAATSTIPVFFFVDRDPVETGLVASLARPGANVTGFHDGLYDEKRLQLLKELHPRAKLVAYLDISPNVTAPVVAAAQSLDVRVLGIAAAVEQDLPRVFAALEAAHADAVMLGPLHWLRSDATARIASRFLSMKMAAIGFDRSFPEAGGLMSFGSTGDYARVVAQKMDRLLRGASPAETPVELPTQFDFVINVKTATAFGLSVSPALQHLANDMIRP